MNKFMSQWYSYGIEIDPPPYLKSKTIYCLCRCGFRIILDLALFNLLSIRASQW